MIDAYLAETETFEATLAPALPDWAVRDMESMGIEVTR